MQASHARLLRAVVLALAAWGASPAMGQVLPTRFEEVTVLSGLNQPTAVRFLPDGRIFVAEKSGIVRVFDDLSDTSPDTFVDIRDRVHDYWDRGLLGLALHPDFASQPYVYLLYTLDARPGESPPSWGDTCPSPPGATADGCTVQGRVSRFRAAGNFATGGEEVLIQSWCQQFPSHSVGSLVFGSDGALYVTGGEGASFSHADYGQSGVPLNPCGDPPVGVGGRQTPPSAEGGALRSQDVRTTTGDDPVNYGGMLLRVDASGAALASNPLIGGAVTGDDRVVAYGLRNPYRMAIRPGTNEVWIGDVGWGSYEEVDVVPNPGDAVVENFGWPCYEGPDRQGGYDAVDLTLCESLYATPAAVTPPSFAYAHETEIVAGDGCDPDTSSISALAFYPGGSYPPEYQGALFFGDYSRNCIWVMVPDTPGGRPNPATVRVFSRGANGPVDLVSGPGGDLFYVDHRTGVVRRIRYTGGTTAMAPTAALTASPTSGAVPLTVRFDASTSTDPNPGDTIRYEWDLDGDGAFDDSTAVAPTYTYSTAGTYNVILRVVDSTGLSDTDARTISAGNSPPTGIIDTPLSTLRWSVGDSISFSGHATDPEQGTLPASALAWEIVMQHCAEGGSCHAHSIFGVSGAATGSFSAPDHPYPSYLEIRLTATDAGGLAYTSMVAIQPNTTTLVFDSVPRGLRIGADETIMTTPFERVVIVGSRHSVSAPSPQTLAGAPYVFSYWSDRGEQTHLLDAGAEPRSLIATFTPACGDGVLGEGEQCDDGNVEAGDCCSPSCTIAAAGTECRAAVGPCDIAETCNGADGACPSDTTRPDGEACPNGRMCDGDETCQAGVCVSPIDTGCHDDDPCTEDACLDSGGCEFVAIDACCRDATDCDDGDACTSDTCSAAGGTCLHSATKPCAGGRDGGPGTDVPPDMSSSCACRAAGTRRRGHSSAAAAFGGALAAAVLGVRARRRRRRCVLDLP